MVHPSSHPPMATCHCQDKIGVPPPRPGPAPSPALCLPLVLLGTVLSKHSRHTHAPGPLHVPFPLPGMLLPPRFTLFMSIFYSSLYTSISPSGRPYLIALPTVLLPSLSISSPCSICVPSTSHYLALPLDDTHTHAVYTYANMCACTHTTQVHTVDSPSSLKHNLHAH